MCVKLRLDRREGGEKEKKRVSKAELEESVCASPDAT